MEALDKIEELIVLVDTLMGAMEDLSEQKDWITPQLRRDVLLAESYLEGSIQLTTQELDNLITRLRKVAAAKGLL